MDGIPISAIVWFIGLMFLNAFIEAIVTALDNVNEVNLEKKIEEGNTRAKLVMLTLEKRHPRYITVFDFIRIITIGSLSVIYATYFWKEIGVFLRQNITDQNLIALILNIVVTIVVLMLVELFSFKIPKKMAFKNVDNFSCLTIKLVQFLMIVFGPFAILVELIAGGILKLFHIKAFEEEVVTEEELISTVTEAQESGVLEAEEAEMIHNIFEFDDKTVSDIMTHRKHMIALDANMTIEEAMQFMMKAAYSRFPVYEDTLENIIGILYLKDVTRIYFSENVNKVKNKKIRGFSRKPYFVPDTQSLDVLFHDMRKRKFHMALAVDEYGQTAGLITMEDIIEEIVGDIQDEYDSEEEDVLLQKDGSMLVKGITSLADLSDLLDLDMEEEDFETLNGLMVSELGHIPSEGEQFTMEYKGCQMEIVEVKNKMISLAKVKKLPKEEIIEQKEAE